MRELALAREVERERFVPLFFGRIQLEAPAAAGIVHQNVDCAQAGQRSLCPARPPA